MSMAFVGIDLQRDFLQGGAIACLDCDGLAASVSELVRIVASRGVPCFFTRDWHPPDHSSFKVNGGTWEVHCVQGTRGAGFPSELLLAPNAVVIDKGVSKDTPGYSGFEHTDLAQRLRALGVTSLSVCGVATEYCVRATVLDALDAGYAVDVLIDLVRPVDVAAGEQALATMQERGARMLRSHGFERA